MSKEFGSIKSAYSEITATSFSGPIGTGHSLQLTQGIGSISGPDTPGFIKISKREARALINVLDEWLKSLPVSPPPEHIRYPESADHCSRLMVKRVMDSIVEDNKWFCDDLKVAVINFGAKLGWLNRTSTTQVEWTEAGAKQCTG